MKTTSLLRRIQSEGEELSFISRSGNMKESKWSNSILVITPNNLLVLWHTLVIDELWNRTTGRWPREPLNKKMLYINVVLMSLIKRSKITMKNNSKERENLSITHKNWPKKSWWSKIISTYGVTFGEMLCWPIMYSTCEYTSLREKVFNMNIL